VLGATNRFAVTVHEPPQQIKKISKSIHGIVSGGG